MEQFLQLNGGDEKFLRSEVEIGSKSFAFNTLSKLAEESQEIFYPLLKEEIRNKYAAFLGDSESRKATNGKPDHILNLYQTSMKKAMPVLIIEEKYDEKKNGLR